MKTRFAKWVCLVLFLASTRADAQIFEFPPSVPLELHKPLDAETRAMQRRAAQLENRGEYQEALRIYLDLFAEFPEYEPFYDGAIRGFILTGDYSKGLAWVDSLQENMLEGTTADDLTATERERLADYIVDGGRLCGRMGKRDEALKRWEGLYSLSHISSALYYRLFSAMIDIRHPDGLQEMAEKARRATGDPSLLAASLASFWAERGDVGRAIDEWLRLMEMQPRQADSIKRAILALPEDEETQKQTLEHLKAALDHQTIRLWIVELLGSVYFRSQQWEEAYKQVKLADQLGGESGLSMLVFAENLNSEKQAQLSLRVLHDLEVSHPELAASPRGLLARAHTQEIIGEYNLADSIYSLLTSGPNLRSAQGQEALVSQAKLRLNRLDQPEAARKLLEDGLRSLPRMRNRGEAALLIGDTYLLQRQLLSAREAYLETASGQFGSDPTLLSTALVNAARVDFYMGHFAEAAERLKQASEGSPDGLLTNDALDMLDLLRAGKADSTNLLKFAQAELEYRRGDATLAESLYVDVAAGSTVGNLVERALWKTAQLQRESGRPVEALSSLTEALDRDPKSLRAPEILLRMAEIHQEDIADPKGAAELYERILIEYPESLQVEEARHRLRNIGSPET